MANGRYSSHRKNFYIEVGFSIKHARTLLDMTQEDLASKVGVSRTTISKMESGQGTYLHTLFDVAQALGIRVSDLLND